MTPFTDVNSSSTFHVGSHVSLRGVRSVPGVFFHAHILYNGATDVQTVVQTGADAVVRTTVLAGG